MRFAQFISYFCLIIDGGVEIQMSKMCMHIIYRIILSRKLIFISNNIIEIDLIIRIHKPYQLNSLNSSRETQNRQLSATLIQQMNRIKYIGTCTSIFVNVNMRSSYPNGALYKYCVIANVNSSTTIT